MKMEYQIVIADSSHLDYLIANDQHIDELTLREKVARQEILVAVSGEYIAGWLRYGFFWDTIPFMNLIWVEDHFRNQGIGTRLIAFWEESMQALGKELVMTSTQANEKAQHLYRRLGYQDKGALFLDGEATEIILLKKLAQKKDLHV